MNFNLFKKKKNTVLKISDLVNAVNKVAKEQGQDYLSVTITYTTYRGITLGGYINGNNWFNECLTVEEVCNKLRQAKLPKPESQITDAIIEEEVKDA